MTLTLASGRTFLSSIKPVMPSCIGRAATLPSPSVLGQAASGGTQPCSGLPAITSMFSIPTSQRCCSGRGSASWIGGARVAPAATEQFASIRGNYCRTAQCYGITKIIIASKCKTPTFIVNERDRNSPFAMQGRQDGTLVTNPDDLRKKRLPAKFSVNSMLELVIPHGITFGEALEIVDQQGKTVTSIGADVVIGRRATFDCVREIGAGSVIGDDCSFSFSTVGRDVQVGRGSNITRVEIGSGVTIGQEASLYHDASLSMVTIGEKTTIGDRLYIAGSGPLAIGSEVKIGHDVYILVVNKLGSIGDRAVLEDKIMLETTVAQDEVIRSSDTPQLEKIYAGEYLETSQLSAAVRKNVSQLNGRTYMSDTAARMLEQEPWLFLASRLSPQAWGQFSLVRDKNAALVSYADGTIDRGSYARFRYFGADEIAPAFLAHERTISSEERSRLVKMPAIISSIRAAQQAAFQNPDLRKRANIFPDSPIHEMCILMSHIKAALAAHRSGTLRFSDIGSGLGAAAKVAALFFQTDGVEVDPLLHQLAQENLPEESSAHLLNGDFFDLDLAPYDIAYFYQQISTEQTSTDPRRLAYETPSADKLRRKMDEFRPGTLILLGPQYLYSDFGGVTYPATSKIGEALFPNLQLLDANLPDDVAHYAVFRR